MDTINGLTERTSYVPTLWFVIRNKKQNFIYRKLFPKKAEAIQWDRLSVDLIGPYKIRREGHDDPLIPKLQ